MPPKVLLLTAAYGEGHNAAARGLQMGLREAGTEAEIFDLFALTGGVQFERSRRAYLGIINHAPRLWAAVYWLIHRVPLVSMSLPLLGKLQRALADLIEAEEPTAIISVYPVYGYLIAKLFPGARPFSFHTVVTDSITINSVWHRCPSDSFIVPNEDSAAVMRDAGVPAAKIHILGFPVPPIFAHDRPARASLAQPHVLYMINAGQAQAPKIVRRLLKVPGIQLSVTIGREERLRRPLEKIASDLGKKLTVLGWTPNMPELLMTHHLLIGKAGGATVQETIAAGTPMLLTKIVPGQEEGNAQLLLQNECGALCTTPDALAKAVTRAFANDAALWRRWVQNISRLSKPDAASDIAQFVLHFAHA
jgi:processive 1,2-diacylglycerol beta-glucosyltransferase